MGPTTFFGTIYESRCTISANFYLYLQYFQQKIFSFNKITDPKQTLSVMYLGIKAIGDSLQFLKGEIWRVVFRP